MKKSILILLCLQFLLFSCQNENIIPFGDNLILEVKDGRLRFETPDEIGDFMQYAKQAEKLEYESKINQLEYYDFYSLQPEYGNEDMELIERVQNRKLEERSRLATIYPNARGLTNENELDDEDEIIGDPYFASILNESREILVGRDVYKYTLDGVYFTDEDNTDALYEYLGSRESREGDPNGRVTKFHEGLQEVQPGVYLIVPLVGECENALRCDGGGSTGGGSTGGGSTGGGSTGGSGSSGSGGEPIIEEFELCADLKKNIWTSVFGPKVVCTDYHDGRRRIKTKVWNQNYFLYSSIGISVRAQKRKLGIWWANEVQELRLGFSHAAFEYPKYKIQWPDNFVNYFYTTPHGFNTDQWGREIPTAQHPINIFEKFPINDKEKVFLRYIRIMIL